MNFFASFDAMLRNVVKSSVCRFYRHCRHWSNPSKLFLGKYVDSVKFSQDSNRLDNKFLRHLTELRIFLLFVTNSGVFLSLYFTCTLVVQKTQRRKLIRSSLVQFYIAVIYCTISNFTIRFIRPIFLIIFTQNSNIDLISMHQSQQIEKSQNNGIPKASTAQGPKQQRIFKKLVKIFVKVAPKNILKIFCENSKCLAAFLARTRNS